MSGRARTGFWRVRSCYEGMSEQTDNMLEKRETSRVVLSRHRANKHSFGPWGRPDRPFIRCIKPTKFCASRPFSISERPGQHGLTERLLAPRRPDGQRCRPVAPDAAWICKPSGYYVVTQRALPRWPPSGRTQRVRWVEHSAATARNAGSGMRQEDHAESSFSTTASFSSSI